MHADTEFGDLGVEQVNHSGTRSVNSGEGASDLQPGEEAPAISATANSAHLGF